MGGVYDHPERSWGFIVVSDPDPRVDEPPGPGEGRIVNVDFEHVYVTAYRDHWRRCQVCPRTFKYAERHVRVTVDLEGDPPLGGSMVSALFCSRECWGKWATAGA